MVPSLKTFARNIKQLSDDPQLFLTTGTEVFRHSVRTNVPALQVAEEAELMVRCLQLIARAILKIENQLSRYTTGTLSSSGLYWSCILEDWENRYRQIEINLLIF